MSFLTDAYDEIESLRAKLAESEILHARDASKDAMLLYTAEKRAEKVEGKIADLIHRVKTSIESNEAILKTSTDTGAMWRVCAYREVLHVLLDDITPKPDTFDYVMSDDDLHPDIAAAARNQNKR